jgi:hypothetical protein
VSGTGEARLSPAGGGAVSRFCTFPQTCGCLLQVFVQVHIGLCAPRMPKTYRVGADSVSHPPTCAPRMPSSCCPLNRMRPQNAEQLLTGSQSALAAAEDYDPRRSRTTSVAPYGVEGLVETTTNILTIKEVADILRCLKTHAQKRYRGQGQRPAQTHAPQPRPPKGGSERMARSVDGGQQDPLG